MSGKCEFWLTNVKFLGHVFSGEGVTVDSSKIDVVQDWKQPKNVFEIWSFLGLAKNYQCFVKDFSRLASPLTRLMRKGIKLVWSEACEKLFQELKTKLITAPVLITSKRGLGYSVHYDTSQEGLGYVLMQERKAVAYGSR
ncbi:uncharacterized protein LOC114289801 [Camellia sinensis]|uniref:uncharacterized protein LOC114289801 n=1 Tax=Camellia sinensis TaxID=4442 RepID=UPI001035BE67|nr:uncharacterized protein LOC114289801 [Camellia sinensis]